MEVGQPHLVRFQRGKVARVGMYMELLQEILA
jgi:hypothetical protein